MSNTSSLRGFTVPVVSSDVNAWGTELNTTIGNLDTILGGSVTFNSSTATTVTLTSSQAQSGRIQFSGTFTSSCTINFLSSVFALGSYVVQNLSSAVGFNVICQSLSSGNLVSIAPLTERTVFADGINVNFADQPTLQAGFEFIIDGGGGTPTSGVKGFGVMPFTFQVTQWTVIADTSNGTGTLDVLKSSYAIYSSGVASVTGSSQPTVSGVKNQSSTLTGWTTTWNSGDVLQFSLSSPSSFTKVTLALTGNRQLSS